MGLIGDMNIKDNIVLKDLEKRGFQRVMASSYLVKNNRVFQSNEGKI